MTEEDVISVWTLYRLDTGSLTGATFAGPQSLLEANTPVGCGAYQGHLDVFAQRIDPETLEPVDFQPPAPSNDAWQTWAWDDAAKRWLSAPTQAAMLDAAKVAFAAAAQGELDALAQSWGYDDIVSAASYAASSVTQFKAEAEALIAWRDAVWTAGYAIEAAVASGSQALPSTQAEFLAMLPAAPTRPAVEDNP